MPGTNVLLIQYLRPSIAHALQKRQRLPGAALVLHLHRTCVTQLSHQLDTVLDASCSIFNLLHRLELNYLQPGTMGHLDCYGQVRRTLSNHACMCL